ncbi:MAG: heme NO-binding domain-containing protein [Paracoccaceae bacterium]
MHGLINKAIQAFVTDSFGVGTWHQVLSQAGLAADLAGEGFEAMRLYDDAITHATLAAASAVLDRPRESLLEDLGTYLISNERLEALRRLLRFGGVSFTDFLYSLEDLQGRSHMAVADLALPELILDEGEAGRFRLTCQDCPDGFGHVMVGILRALADDYGALAVLDHEGRSPSGHEAIAIDLFDPSFHAGRHFDLVAGG